MTRRLGDKDSLGEASDLATDTANATVKKARSVAGQNTVVSLVIAVVIASLLIFACYLKRKYGTPVFVMTKKQYEKKKKRNGKSQNDDGSVKATNKSFETEGTESNNSTPTKQGQDGNSNVLDMFSLYSQMMTGTDVTDSDDDFEKIVKERETERLEEMEGIEISLNESPIKSVLKNTTTFQYLKEEDVQVSQSPLANSKSIEVSPCDEGSS